MKISFCKYNEGHEEIMNKIKEAYPDFQLTVNQCIGVCDKCGNAFIARVDGILVEAETKEELYHKIIEKVK